MGSRSRWWLNHDTCRRRHKARNFGHKARKLIVFSFSIVFFKAGCLSSPDRLAGSFPVRLHYFRPCCPSGKAFSSAPALRQVR